MNIKKVDLLKLILLTCFISIGQDIFAQKLIGFWEVKEVRVGAELMTPVAKWIKLNKDGTFQSGNGWLQNGVGTWSYDQKSKMIDPRTLNGIKEGFGGFHVSYEKDQMIWKRMEDGMEVIVTYIPISELPESPADQVVGLWDLTEALENGRPILKTFDPDNQYYIFIRWDRIYRERTREGNRSTGYWHMHGHRPEITLLSHQKGKDAESWRVSFEEGKLKLTGISDTNIKKELIFQRIDEFPK